MSLSSLQRLDASELICTALEDDEIFNVGRMEMWLRKTK